MRWSLPVRGAWIEMGTSGIAAEVGASLPVRGAWIEIETMRFPATRRGVAPRAGSVD